MPSETIDFKSFSSSLYSSEDICSSKERQASLWKSDNMPNCYDFDQGIKTSLNVQSLSHLSDSSKVNVVATQHESSLFSSSLSELFSRKLRLSANNALYGHSVDTVASHYEEERLFDSLEELEAQIIGNLLPSDDDLLSGVTNGLDHIIQDSSGDDTDELDLFSSVGGMDLGHDNCSSSEQKNSEILDEACNSQLGLRSASIAGEQPYSEHPSRTIVVRNINSQHKESNVYLHQNSLPLKSPTSFPGLHGISKSGKLDGGRVLGVEPAICTPSPETAFFHGVSSSVPNSLPSLVRVKSADNRCEVTESGSPGQLNFDSQAAPAFHPHSLPEFHDGLANSVHHIPPEVAANINLKTQERIDNMQFCQVNSNGRFMEFNECVFKSSGNGSCPLPGHHYKWGNSYQPPGMMWPNSPSYIDGVCAATNLPRLHGLPRSHAGPLPPHYLRRSSSPVSFH